MLFLTRNDEDENLPLSLATSGPGFLEDLEWRSTFLKGECKIMKNLLLLSLSTLFSVFFLKDFRNEEVNSLLSVQLLTILRRRKKTTHWIQNDSQRAPFCLRRPEIEGETKRNELMLSTSRTASLYACA